MKGKRLKLGEFPDNPGEYAKFCIKNDKGPVIVAWLVHSPLPDDPPFLIGRPNPDGSPYHWVRENPDRTITVEPNPPDAPPERRNSNSILSPGGWHGYIYDGEWRQLP